MAFTLYSLIQTAILCTNAIAVLHEERFLSKSEYNNTQRDTLTHNNNKKQNSRNNRMLLAASGEEQMLWPQHPAAPPQQGPDLI